MPKILPETEIFRHLKETVASLAARGAWEACRSEARKLLLLNPGDAVDCYYLSLSARNLDAQEQSHRSAVWGLRAAPARGLTPLMRELFLLRASGARERAWLRRALLVTPGAAQGLVNLADGLIADKHPSRAIAMLRRARAARPLDTRVLRTMAWLQGPVMDDPAAAAAFVRLLTHAPADFEGLRAFGLWARKRDIPGEGARWFRRAVAVRSDVRAAQAELGRALLSDGALREGWCWMERFRLPEWETPISGLAKWSGEALADGALLLWSMNMIGDELLYSVFLDRARAAAGRLVVLVDRRNVPLLALLHPDIRFCASLSELEDAGPEWRPTAGYPLDFVGRFFAETADDMASPGGLPRLPAGERVARRPLRVGISWKSSADEVGDLKSTRLQDWKAILETPGCRFFSLQYGDVEGELAPFGMVERIAGFDPFGSTLDFARTISDLDLVISVSNTTVHVASRTATPVWVLLSTGLGCAWFYFREREDSPAYANARLFRQTEPGVWTGALARAAEELAARVA